MLVLWTTLNLLQTRAMSYKHDYECLLMFLSFSNYNT